MKEVIDINKQTIIEVKEQIDGHFKLETTIEMIPTDIAEKMINKAVDLTVDRLANMGAEHWANEASTKDLKKEVFRWKLVALAAGVAFIIIFLKGIL